MRHDLACPEWPFQCVGMFVAAFLAGAVATASTVSWTTHGPAVPGNGTDIVVDLQRPGTVYASSGPELARSLDNGKTWVTLQLESPGSRQPLGSFPLAASNGVVYAAFLNGEYGEQGWDMYIYRSLDAGDHWQQWLHPGTLRGISLAIDPVHASTLYRVDVIWSGDVPLYRSRDGGQSWTRINPDFASLGNLGLLIDPKTPETLYLAYSPSSPSPGQPGDAFFKSTDSGTSWTYLSGTLGRWSAVAIDPVTTSTLYVASDVGLHRSRDGGATFALVNPSLSISRLVIDPVRNDRLFALATTGVPITTRDPAAPWTTIDSGLEGLPLQSLAVDASGSYLHAGAAPGVFDYPIDSSTCAAGARTLCLNGGRFSVTADFQRTPEGPSSPATAVPLTGDTGYFWFFDSANVEMVVKVLTGCSVNGEYWVFAGGLTNVGVEWKVTDTETGGIKTYSNAVGTPFQPVQDSSAFSCP